MMRASTSKIFASAGVTALLLLVGCQVGSTTSQSAQASQNQAIVVTVSPGSGSVQTGMSLQFSALVQGDSANKGVTWSIQSSAGCDCGTIDSTGKYFAPTTAHPAPGLVILATSVSDPTKSGNAVILVTPAPTQITVTITPPNGSVQVGRTLQFSASVQGDPANKGVTWSINQYPAGCDCGTVDSTGKYFAPQTPRDALGIIISATSVSDPTKSGTAVVWVTPAPAGLGVFPSIAAVPVNGRLAFSATATPFTSVPVVTWSISGSGCSSTSCGTIDDNGNYTASATVPAPASVRIKATSVADASVDGFADVTIGSTGNPPDNAKLNGHYAFLLRGYNGDGNTAFAGSFIADGKGTISGGIGDFVFSSSIIRIPDVTFTGNYWVGSDNRASILITSPLNWINGLTFTLSLASFDQGVANRGQMIELDSSDMWIAGFLAKQDPTAFSTAAVSGSYAFGFGGTAFSGFPLETAGRFTASGGSITAGQADVYGVGLAESGAGTVVPEPDVAFTGIYTVSSTGRGTAVLTGLPYDNFSFYVISSGELIFLELEDCGTGICFDKSGISGTALRQSGGPFTTASLKGTSVFETFGWDGVLTHGAVAVGQDSFDGNGSVSETREQNDTGAIATSTINGTYTVDSNGLGRGLINLPGSAQPRPFYLVSPGKAFVMDLASYQAGSFEPQVPGPFNNASIVGPYAVGTLPSDMDWVFVPTTGELTADGAGNLTGTGDSRGGTGIDSNGNYSVAPNGRVATTIVSANGATSNWVFYIVSSSKAVGIDVTPGTANSAVRIIEK